MVSDDQWREQRRAAVIQKESFRGLTQHPGWEKLTEIVRGQIEARMGQVLQVLESESAVFAQEYMKGEIQGLRLMLALPEVQMTEAEAVLSRLGLVDEDEDE